MWVRWESKKLMQPGKFHSNVVHEYQVWIYKHNKWVCKKSFWLYMSHLLQLPLIHDIRAILCWGVHISCYNELQCIISHEPGLSQTCPGTFYPALTAQADRQRGAAAPDPYWSMALSLEAVIGWSRTPDIAEVNRNTALVVSSHLGPTWESSYHFQSIFWPGPCQDASQRHAWLSPFLLQPTTTGKNQVHEEESVQEEKEEKRTFTLTLYTFFCSKQIKKVLTKAFLSIFTKNK